MSVQINVQASQTALAQSIAQGVAAFNSRYAGQNQLNLQINARNFSQPLGRITSDLADFESALKASNARVLAFGASTAVLGGVVKSFKEIANVTLEVEKSLTDINRVLNLSTNNLQKFSSELFSISKQTASSFDDATKAALEFSRQGLNTEETLKRTADALTLVRLTGISSTKAVEDLTATINGFAKAGLTTSQVVNKLAAVEQDFAVSASDLTEALSRTGQAAQEAGVSFDELNALVTTAQQNTARGGAVIGNALKTIFTRLQRTETLDQLQNFNIAVRDIEGNILPAVQILKNFADRYNDLADAQRAQLSEQVAGVYQVNILKGVIKDLNNNQGTYVQALQRGAMAANEAEIANQRLNKTLSALVTQTGVGLQQLANNVGKVTFAPIFEAIVSPVNDAVSYINDTLEGEGIGSVFANGLLKGVRNVIAGPGLAVAFAVIAKVAKNTFEDATKALPAILGLTTEAQKRANIEKSIISILQTQSNLSLALQGQQGNLSTQAATVLNYARLQTAQYQQQLQIAQQLAPLLAAQNVTVGTRGIQVGPRIKAGGHIPAFAEMSERMGAAMGGYKSGKVVKAPKSVGANTYMNSAEEIKYVSGFAQPFINPPAGSKAGRTHRKNAINRTGVDPYMASGFIPNFVKGVDLGERGKEFEKLINFYLINEKTSAGSDLLDFALPSNALTKASFKNKNKISLNPLSFYGDAKIKSTKETQKDLIKKLVGSLDEITYGKLITRANKIKSNVINLNDFLPVKPSLISSKSSITKDNENASVESVLGFDVIEKLQRLMKNDATQRLTGDAWENKKLKLSFIDDYVTIPDFSNSGFIPNFAPPTSAIRVPWFKKFGNPAFDTIQPTLGISKANDTDTFRSSQFRSKAFDKAAIDGDPNLFAPLYEDFAFKAMQLISQSDIKDDLMRGYVLQPGTDQKQAALDAVYRKKGIGVEYKGYPKKNLTGTIGGELKRKYETLSKTNPEEAAKLQELIIAFNEVGHENQLPSAFGKNFTQLAGTSYSQMVKNSPDLVKGLSEETNMLLNRYVKNPAFLSMSAAKGFIPNFGKYISTKFFKTQTGPELFSSKGTGLSGTVYKQPGYKSYGYQLKEQLNNMVMSILGNNVFFPDASSLNPKIYGDVNKGAENSAKNAALKLSSAGKTSSLGLGSGMMSETFGNSRLNFNPEAVYTGQISGKMKRVNYDRLSDVLGAFWSGNPQTKSAWESLKNLSESGKFEEKESIRAKTSLLKKAYEEFLIKNDYIGTRVKLSSYRKRAEGVEGVNYGSLRSDLAGVSDVRNLSKNNGFIPNFASMISSSIKGKGNISAIKTGKNNYEIEGVEVGKKFRGQGLGSQLYGSIAQKIGSGSTIKSVLLPQEQALADYASGKNVPAKAIFPQLSWAKMAKSSKLLVNGKEIAISDFESGIASHKYNASKLDMALIELINSHASGFIPNFNFIKGRNSFQKNWLIETAKKRNLNLNDPNTFTKLATEFAKTYPNDQGMFGFSKGFIPNFAYKQAVMGLEESMSGNKAIFDTKPFPHIRNSSQPNFASAISDHGGLKNALNDSMRNQEAAGLMSNGFVPNFATLNAQQALGIPFKGLGANEQKLFVDMNKALSELTRNTKLTSQQQQILVNTVQTNALTLQQSTKSASIVNDANNALVKALQQNANAQQKAAAQTTAQAAQQQAAAAQAAAAQAAAQNVQQQAQLSGIERIGKFLGGAKGAARGAKIESSFGKLSNNIGFTLGVPMLAGVAESFISQNKDRSEMGYAQRLASSGTSAALSGATTGALLGSVVPGIGNALGAAIGATVGFAGAALNARTSLDDLSKSINTVIDRNRKDVDAAKTIGELEKQMAGETDPFAIAVLKMKIQEAADSISNTEFAKKLLNSSQSVEEFNRTINEFVLSSGPLNQLGNLPSLIQSFSKKTGTLEERSFGYVKETFTGNVQNIFGIYSGKIEKKLKYAAELAGSFFDPIGITFLNIQEQIAKKSPEAAKNFSDILNNVLEFRESGVLESKLKTLVDSKDIPQQVADQILKIVNQTNNSYFDLYLGNLKARLPFLKDQIKKSAPIREGRVADIESSKVVFAKINNEIQTALNEATLQLMNIEFKSNIGKLNIEKIGGIFDTAASAIGKNLESIAKSQFDALMVQIQLSREAQLADLNRTQFEETRNQEMNKYLAERKSRVSTFFEKNIAPGESSRKLAVEALSKIGSDLTYDFKNLESLAYNMGVEVENARKDLIRNEEFQKKSFLTQRSNAKTLFDQEQSYAKDLRDLKKKAAEEDLKLEEIKYANLLREKQIIQSFDFANQARQIQTQGEISRMGLGMEVNPNFFAGASRFQQEDYKFRLDREKEDKRIAAEIRTATEQQRIVDIQRQVMSANTDATNENTKAIREYTIAFLKQQLSKVESGLSESKNASEKIEKIVTKTPNEKAPLDRKKTFADPENYVEKSFRFFNQAPQNNLIPGTNIDRRAGVNNYNYQDSTPQTPASEDKSPSLFEKYLDRFINFLNSTYSPKSRVLSDGPIYSGGQSFIQSENTNIPQYKGGDFLNLLNEGNRYVDAKQMYNAVTTPENREIEVQREVTAEKQKQVELENQRKNINEQLQSIIKERTSTVQSSVSRISPDLSRVGIAKDELERLSGQLKINETSLAQLEAERKTTIESSRQVQLDQQIFDLQEKINKGKLDQLNYTEQIDTIEKRIKANNEYLASRGKFSTGVANAVGKIREETEMFKETLGSTTVNAFRDGLVGAMDAALNKADDLESALMGVAAGFLREIQGVMLRNIANQAISSFMPSYGTPASGNQRGGIIRAQKGMYISGGRTGDKNPALLEDGEYVLNRNAVKALGGPRAIDNLNFNAFPRFATGGDPGTMSASVSMNEPFERLSMYGREQSPEFQNYVERLREAEAAREKKRAERKALLNQFLTTLITTGVMAGLTSGVQGLKSKFGSKTPLNKVAGSKPNLAQRAQLKKAGVAIGPDGYPAMQTGGAIGFNQGGFLPYGSRLTDSIPAYLTGGEYVVNSRAVRKYGVGGLNRINSGVAKFQDGGMVGTETGSPSNTSNTANNNVSINITVNASGGKVGDQESDSNSEGTEGNAKELSNRIKAVVLDVITSEQRTGGLLDSTKKR